MRRPTLSALSAVALTAATGFATLSHADVDTDRIASHNTPENAGQWLSHGRDYNEQRFSPLDEINVDTVDELGLAWFADLEERGGSYETTPIVVDGRIFVSAPWSRVYAFDAKTGEQLWKYDPEVPGEWAVNLCCGIVNRGVAAWEDTIVWGTLDGRLVSVDAESGELVWEAQVTDPEKAQSITGAPRIADGRIFIGEAGSEFHQRGYLAAYDANNGDELWRWWAVPGNPEDGFEQPELEWAAETWNGEWWEFGGGGTPWDAITYDPVTDLVYVGTGNGAPWPSEVRSPGGGDNLFTASIVALDAKTGEYRWHYQTTPEDSWDFDNTQQLVTADLVIDGEEKRVVMQAPKNGVFYVLEAETGKVLSAELFVPSANWMLGFEDEEDYRPILNPEANYGKTDKGFHVVPSAAGAHSWHPMAFSPDTGLMYIPTNYSSFPLVAEAGAKMGNQLLSINVARQPEDPAPELEGEGSYLLAWDPVTSEPVWQQRKGSSRAGVLATGGNLVFQGGQENFSAFRADTGDKLWSADTQTGIVGGGVSYAVDGEQYVAVVAGASGFGGSYWAPNYARLLVYKLGGDATLPPKVSWTPRELDPPENFGDEDMLALGEANYNENCASCHGNNGRVSSMFPDLRYAPALNSGELFHAIVIDGILQDNGMVSFRDSLTAEDAEAIRAYVVSLANEAKNAPPFGGFGGGGPGGDADEESDEGESSPELHQ